MKKKIFLAIMAFSFLTSSIDGLVANAPKVIPDKDAEMNVAVDKAFDYRKVRFTDAEMAKTGEINEDILNKIFLDVSPKGREDSLEKSLSDNSFAAYCLDATKKYPEYNIASNDLSKQKLTIEKTIEGTFPKNLYTKYNGNNANIADNIAITLDSYTMNVAGETDAIDAAGAIDALLNNKSVIVKLNKLIFLLKDRSVVEIDASKTEETNNAILDYYNYIKTTNIELKPEEVWFTEYSSTIPDNVASYDKALWIIEHSYPTLNLEQTYAAADANYTKAIVELLVLQNSASGEEAKSKLDTTVTSNLTNSSVSYLDNAVNALNELKKCANNIADVESYKGSLAKDINILLLENGLSSEIFAEDGSNMTSDSCKSITKKIIDFSQIENYTYTTVQHAIWKADPNGNGMIHGEKINDELKGSVELNKLYQYLIKDRDIGNYSTKTYSNTLNLGKPDSKKEIYKDNKDNYIYGPYKVTGDILSVDSITISVEGDTKGVSIVNKDGNEISAVNLDESFYVKCNKSDKITNVKIKLTANNAKSFNPSTNRARIYYAKSNLYQNVISGGKIVDVEVENSFELVYNPKTGVVNLAIIFMIGIVAFTLGYLAINSKNPEIDLG